VTFTTGETDPGQLAMAAMGCNVEGNAMAGAETACAEEKKRTTRQPSAIRHPNIQISRVVATRGERMMTPEHICQTIYPMLR